MRGRAVCTGIWLWALSVLSDGADADSDADVDGFLLPSATLPRHSTFAGRVTARYRAEKQEATDTDTRQARVMKGLRWLQGRIGRTLAAVHVAVEEIDVH